MDTAVAAPKMYDRRTYSDIVFSHYYQYDDKARVYAHLTKRRGQRFGLYRLRQDPSWMVHQADCGDDNRSADIWSVTEDRKIFGIITLLLTFKIKGI